MRDFSLNKYDNLLVELKNSSYAFLRFKDFFDYTKKKIMVLRHDVDLLPQNSLVTAKLEKEKGICGTYYFRIIPETFDTDIIKRIYELGHEIGYHYETVDKVTKSSYEVKKLRSYGVMKNSDEVMKNSDGVKELWSYEEQRDSYEVKELRSYGELEKRREEIIDRAYELFCEELEMFRKVVPVETICMHGSPRAKYDNKMIWEKYDYRELGIVGEPYFDVDWNVFGYLTDTGRRWNGDKYSVRDKVNSKYKFDFKTTDDIIRNVDMLPERMMITVHPQRWTDDVLPWAKELVWQNVKNGVKRFLVRSER